MSGSIDIRKANPFEKIVAQRVSDSKTQIPHFYVTAEADVSALLTLRSEINSGGAKESRLSVNDFIIAAVTRSMSEFPALNAVWQSGDIATFKDIDVGVVVSTSKGLYIPILKNIVGKDIHVISQMMSEMATLANAGKLTLDQMTGGAISISNVGMFGSVAMLPIINFGQSSVLGVGAPAGVFRPDKNDRPVLCNEIKLALACDHRIFDGVKATQLLARIVEILAAPEMLIQSS
ncbi:MAG: 2-oxo acid dehydrogenase subunit E2 [Halieaceae bacterium]|nr:2-oxo acid dehydrogenase subunit E2 [Halieaceae bacterium]